MSLQVVAPTLFLRPTFAPVVASGLLAVEVRAAPRPSAPPPPKPAAEPPPPRARA